MAVVEHLMDPSVAPDLQTTTTAADDIAYKPDKSRGSSERLLQVLGEKIIARDRKILEGKSVSKVETELLTGDAATAITDLARAAGVDAIVLGTRGLSQVKGLLLGSVSHKIIQLAECTCIISR